MLNRIKIRSDVFGKHQFDLRVVGRGRAIYRLAHEGGGGILRQPDSGTSRRASIPRSAAAKLSEERMKKLILFLLLGLSIAGSAARQNAAATPIQGDESLVVQHADVPLYPAMAKIARVSGTVQVEVTVRDGSVVNTQVLKSSAHPILVSAATENLKTWQFLPQTNAKFTTTYIYELEKKEAPLPENPRIQMQLPKLVKITVRPTKPTCMDCGAHMMGKPILRQKGDGQ